MMHQLRVNLGENSYDIAIEGGLLAHVGERLAGVLASRKVALVTDANVNARYGAAVSQSLRAAGFAVHPVVIEAGEEQKALHVAERLYDWFFEFDLDRRSAVIALGGGVVGDLAGFAAATFKRGVPYVQVPTTLLSQVDSSIGGKVAVNHPRGKNMIGAFYQPKAVLIDPATLQTLPPEEFASGMAEVIKHGVIRDPELFEFLETHMRAVREADVAVMEHVVAANCRVKAAVVEADEKESGLRGILNFGHTFGHAIETATGYSTYRHGEAVAVGMIAACRIAEAIQLCPAGLAERVGALAAAYRLPGTVRGLDPDRAFELLAHDKKARDGKVVFVLPVRLGEVTFVDDVPESVVRQAILSVLSE